jgi:hypothetical protein
MDVPTYSTAANRALEIRWAGLKPPYPQGARKARRAQSNEGVGGGSALSSMCHYRITVSLALSTSQPFKLCCAHSIADSIDRF